MDSLKIFLLWLGTLILICLIGITNVFADSYNNIGYLTNNSDVLVEVSYTGSPLPLTHNTTYQLEQVEALDINVSNYTFSDNTVYSIELSTPNTTLSNGNIYTAIGTTSTNQSVSCSVYDITYTDIHYPNFRFKCSSSINSLNIRVFNPSGSYIMPTGIFSWNYAYLRSVNIDDSSQDIIDNQNQNTQDIIDNQNQNTQAIINSQYTCKNQSINLNNFVEYSKSVLNSSGSMVSNDNLSITEYIRIKKNSDYTINLNYSSSNRYCLYDETLTLISCPSYNNTREITFNSSSAEYIRLSIRTDTSSRTSLIGGVICLKDSQILDNTLNDDDSSGATSEASDFFNSFNTNTFGLTSIITAPLNLIQSLTSKTCSPLHLPLPYLDNKFLDLPCMNTIYQQYFGSFFTLYQTITYGIIAYWVCVRIFNQVKDFKNPEHDEIEVMDL